MSTKIYNGYKIPNYDLIDLQKFCLNLKDKIKQKAEELIIKKILHDAVYNIDKLSQGINVEIQGNHLSSAFYNCVQNINKIKETGQRNPDYDFDCNICIIPTDEDFHLMIVYTEKNDFLEIIDNDMNIESYCYYNNTDRPKNVSNEEWETRKEHWSKYLLKKINSRPSDLGFSYILWNPDDIHEVFFDSVVPLSDHWENIKKYIPTVKTRAKELSLYLMDVSHIPKDKNILNSYVKYMHSDEGKTARENKIKELTENLKPITQQDFLNA